LLRKKSLPGWDCYLLSTGNAYNSPNSSPVYSPGPHRIVQMLIPIKKEEGRDRC